MFAQTYGYGREAAISEGGQRVDKGSRAPILFHFIPCRPAAQQAGISRYARVPLARELCPLGFKSERNGKLRPDKSYTACPGEEHSNSRPGSISKAKNCMRLSNIGTERVRCNKESFHQLETPVISFSFSSFFCSQKLLSPPSKPDNHYSAPARY